MRPFGSISRLSSVCLLLLLSACVMTPTTSGQQIGAPIDLKYVPCSQIKIIPYHAPKDDKSPQESAANIYDTPETIDRIQPNNASIREACK